MIATARALESPTATPDLWRALANPVRRSLLDMLRARPATTGQLSSEHLELSRFAVMQHLEILVEAGLVTVERRGRERYNHLNPVPLRAWYERWVTPFADRDAGNLLELRRFVLDVEPQGHQQKGIDMATATPELARTVRLEFELTIAAPVQRVFEVMTARSLEWSPYTYGEERTKAVILEPFVGGRHYEDWGDGAGHLYGWVTGWDSPRFWSTRGRVSAGTIMDTEYSITDAGDGAGVVVHVSKVVVGPLTDEEADGIRMFGDIRPRASEIERLARE